MIALALVAVVAALAALARGADGDDDTTYRIVFDNAFGLTDGGDFRIAGVRAGAIEDLRITRGYPPKAVAEVKVTEPGFADLREDALCEVRPQSLIGEYFVDCQPGDSGRRLPNGGLLPVERTTSTIPFDLVNTVMRRPYRERFRLIISELGAGLAGRPEDLSEVLRRAHPGLRETSQALRILGRQTRTIERAIADADRVIAELERRKRDVVRFVEEAGETAEITASRRAALADNFRLLPTFLAELRPYMARLGELAGAQIPLLRDLGAAAPDLARLIEGQGTLADASREALPSLGDALERGRPTLVGARPLIRDLGRLGEELEPTSADLDELTKSLDETGATERINDFLYYVALSTNGFDELGHYLRAGLVANTCTTYALQSFADCPANFSQAGAASAARTASAADTTEPRNARAPKGKGGSVAPGGSLLQGVIGPEPNAGRAREREANLEALRKRATRGRSPALGGEEPVLEYLFGEEDR